MSTHRNPRKRLNNVRRYEPAEESLASINQARAQIGLPELKKIKRFCLKCDTEFEAYERSANFMCEACCNLKSNRYDWR